MKDFAGNELEVGMKVVCLCPGASNSWMIWGEVIGFTPQKVRIEYVSADYTSTEGKRVVVWRTTLRDPDNVVLPMTEELANALRSEYLHSS